jgi:hypothetical protein
MRQLDAGLRLHVLEDQVIQRSDAHAAVGQRLVARLARQCDQLIDAVDTQVLARHEHHHRIGHRVHQAKVFRLQLDRGIRQWRQDHLVGRTLEYVVAVGGRRQNLLRGQRPADTAQVLDQHLRPTRRVRDHQIDRLGRVTLRGDQAGAERQTGRQDQGPQKHETGHGELLEGRARRPGRVDEANVKAAKYKVQCIVLSIRMSLKHSHHSARP